MTDRQGPIPDSYWVVPGCFLAGEYPGARDSDEARRKLAEIRGSGIDCFIDLTEDGEYGLRPYEDMAGEIGPMEHIRFGIEDLGHPTIDGMREIVRTNNREWRTLPPHAYHSEEIFELEKDQDRLFFKIGSGG